MILSLTFSGSEHRVCLMNVPAISIKEKELTFTFIGDAPLTINEDDAPDIDDIIVVVKKVLRSVDPRDPYGIKWIETKGIFEQEENVEVEEVEAFINASLIDHVSMNETIILDFAAGGCFSITDKIEAMNIKPLIEKYFQVTVKIN